MAFEQLSEKFTRVIKKMKGEARLTDKNMDEMLKEVKIALLEADVNFKVVKEFANKNYRPELLFEDKEIVERISAHPMALWRVREN